MSRKSPNSAAGSCANAPPWGERRARSLADDVAERTIERLRDADPEATTSMLVDRRTGRRIEADAMTGAVVRIGAQTRNPHALKRGPFNGPCWVPSICRSWIKHIEYQLFITHRPSAARCPALPGNTPANPRICRHRVERGPWQNSPALRSVRLFP